MATASGPGRATIGSSFDPRRNSLNFLRLVLAVTVVISHTSALGGFAGEWIFQRVAVGTLAVYGFFGISGYLIASSALHNSLGRYLWQRFLRIMPGYWVCLVVTALGIGAIGWSHAPHIPCSLSCYYTKVHPGPFQFLYHNALLRVNQTNIGRTPKGIPLPLNWNGSLWTLFYEALCYLLLAGLAVTGLLRRRGVVAALTGMIWLAEGGLYLSGAYLGNFDAWAVLTLFPIFLTGTLIYSFRESLFDSGWLALLCTMGFGVALACSSQLGFLFWATHVTFSTLFAPLMAYPIMWLGIHLPFDSVGSRNDYSYGVYIYAFPVQQLLAVYGVQRWGYFPFLILSFVGTAPLAIASWWLVEKRALALKNRGRWALQVSRNTPVPHVSESPARIS